MNQLLSIQDNKIVIKSLELESLSGAVNHSGSFSVQESVSVGKDLTVTGNVTANTIRASNIISDTGTIEGVGLWNSDTEDGLNGKGFNWSWGYGSTFLQYRLGGKIWTNGDFDIAGGKSYQIEGVNVLSQNGLGPQVKTSNLQEVGILNELNVSGEANIGDFAFFSSNFNRLGINTSSPNASISIIENGVEIAIGSHQIGKAYIGTYSNHDLVLGADSTAHITIQRNGEIVFGNEQSKSSVVKIYGELIVDNVTTDHRTDRYSPLTFNASTQNSIYGLGLEWTGAGSNKQFVMKADPERLWSSESIDLAENQCYYINGKPVLTEGTLGSSVTQSKLVTLGSLRELNVSGDATFSGNVVVRDVMYDNGNQQMFVRNSRIDTNKWFTLNVGSTSALSADAEKIVLGSADAPSKPVKVFGPLSVGINNPDPRVSLAVRGNVSFNDRIFISGDSAPAHGLHTKGDICWNNNPTPGNFIGWVCISEGNPGTWVPFGAIERQ